MEQGSIDPVRLRCGGHRGGDAGAYPTPTPRPPPPRCKRMRALRSRHVHACGRAAPARARTRRAGFHPCFACVGAREWRSVPMQSRILALAVAGILPAPPIAMAEGAAATDLDELALTAPRHPAALA